nr:hypothetical protein CFP56_04323 [Quercus suber]
MLVTGHMHRGDQSLDIFDGQGGLGTDPILRQILIERRPQELAIDQKFQGDGLFRLQKSVDERRQLVALEFWWDRVSWSFRSESIGASSVPVETRMGPVSGGSSMSLLLVFRCMRTCEALPARAETVVVRVAMIPYACRIVVVVRYRFRYRYRNKFWPGLLPQATTPAETREPTPPSHASCIPQTRPPGCVTQTPDSEARERLLHCTHVILYLPPLVFAASDVVEILRFFDSRLSWPKHLVLPA